MAKILPSQSEMLEFGKYAVGGVVEEMVSNWAKQKITVEFIQKYPILIDVGMFFVLILPMRNGNMNLVQT